MRKQKLRSKDVTLHDAVRMLQLFFTFLLVWGTLLKLSSKLILSACLLALPLSFSTGSRIGPRPRNAAAAAFLVTALVRRPVKPVVIRGVSTTNEEIDLSFLLIGTEMGDSTLASSIFVFFDGKIFDLTSCLLWSALESRYQKWVEEKHKFKMKINSPRNPNSEELHDSFLIKSLAFRCIDRKRRLCVQVQTALCILNVNNYLLQAQN
jgi:hypothetical protein